MKIKFIILLVAMPYWLHAQQVSLGDREPKKVDSMRQMLINSTNDSVRFQMSINLSNFYQFKNDDSALFYTRLASDISRKNGKRLAEAESHKTAMYYYYFRGDYSNAWQSIMKALEIARDPASEKTHYLYPTDGNFRKQRLEILAYLEVTFGDLLLNTNNYRESIQQYEKAIAISAEIDDVGLLHHRYNHIGWAYKKMDMPDSALYYTLLAERTAKEKNLRYNIEIIYNNKGELLLKKGMVQEALQSHYDGLRTAEEDLNRTSITDNCLGLSACYIALEQKDSSLYYALKARDISPRSPDVYEGLYQSYQLNNEKDSAFKYMALAKEAKEKNNKDYLKKLAGFQHLFLQDRIKLENLEKEKIQARSRIRTYLLLGGIVLLLLLSGIFYRTSKQRQKAKTNIEKAYVELKKTQQQLVQREKMASLGELTAGIAHEIQNPLNFVNNFSDVNKELLEEMKAGIDKGNLAEVKSIASDIIDNEEKINQHGKRADSIVKSMLQHSRASSGNKEPTNINAMCDEYLRLAYHGMRAKDKTFNVKLNTHFDSSIGKIILVPQEIGRVILNLANNAFYAVTEKAKNCSTGYEPIVTVSTGKLENKIEIRVKDNGVGIPQNLIDKIFQPFFTTKAAGQGTGLGLSLAYDIITKGHGGELQLETKEGEGSEFIIQLPV
jgi:two-component system, NtrC family, sensor kinase